ncbi:MAG: hypothetical protein IPQ03_10605 [Bacteroidetes bacterium]|nr:hypothetical protein [Bacteroidota bacterium]MBP6401326.1 hypothetical protein [Bacteroidia bacterium]MBK9524322.1 hypothetical protein [Bacteroidota bacterium]MBK9543606.1 hypothetical protein [Bacteroidota bacterium]MBL0257929.1 hypothetical protein [Bacteroidota bacterium]
METILASAAIAAIISVTGTIVLNIYLNRKTFKNDYFKIIIQKRIETYELLEDQISILKLSVINNDGRNDSPYHQIFSMGTKHLLISTQNLVLANGKSVWLNMKTNNKMTELVQLGNAIGLNSLNDSDLIDAGRKHYWKIAQLRDELEILIQKDILTLYDFSQMIKRKLEDPRIHSSSRT